MSVSKQFIMTRTLLLDLDGTLVDSVPDLAGALDRLFAARGLAPLSHPQVAGMVGDGVAALVEKAFTARGLSPDERAIPDFTADYWAHAADATVAFPGVVETLGMLRERGWRMAVCTNKPMAPTRALLDQLSGYFAAVGAGDSFPVRKPNPGHLLATLALAEGQPARAVMVGDHRNDVLAANGAGIRSVFALWGYGPSDSAEGATATAPRFAALPELVDRLVPAA
jgi:phosphoglycolate phosphatase